MLRFYVVVGFSIPIILYYILMANYMYNHADRYDEKACYKLVRSLCFTLQRRGRIRTIATGSENLPKEGGYIMYSNHQGRYDALGIMSVHEKPCSVVMDAERSKVLLANQIVRVMRGKRLERNNLKQQYGELQQLTEEVKEGRRYIYFPEGGYNQNGNVLQEFRPGAFKCAKSAEAPIVPVAIYDSHLVFDFNTLKKVTTQVCFLEPIYYEEYSNMTTKQISEMVKSRIEAKLADLEENRARHGYNAKFKIYSNG